MQQLNLHRLARLMGNELRLRGRLIGLLALTLLSLAVALHVLGSLGWLGNTFETVPPQLFSISEPAALAYTGIAYANTVYMLATFLILTSAFADMGRKTGETAYLLLPASHLEKWLSRVLCALLVGWGLVTVLGYAANLLSAGIIHFYRPDVAQAILNNLLHPYALLDQMGIKLSAPLFGYSLAISVGFYAYFLYGSIRFRHNAWLYTALWGVAIYLVLSVGTGFLVGFYGARMGAAHNHESFAQFALQLTLPIVRAMAWTGLAAGVLFTSLSYRCFRNRQLESKKTRLVRTKQQPSNPTCKH